VLRILGSKKRLCDGLTRRDLLQVGGLSPFGLGLSQAMGMWQSEAQAAELSNRFGKAKSCILLFLFGSPPQHETFDPKPDAPLDIQGEMQAIPTSVPGLHIGEGLPQTAKIIDRTTIVRSLTHPYPIHGLAYALSGVPTTDIPMEITPRDPRHWPFIGSVVDHLEARRHGGAPQELLHNVAMPWLFYSKSDYPPISGPYSGFLDQKHDPVWTTFDAKGTKFVPNCITGTESSPDFFDPYAGIRPNDTLGFADGKLSSDVGPSRLENRWSLLEQFDAQRRTVDAADTASFTHDQAMAYSLLTSSKMHKAMDVRREAMKVRERYGMTLFGQATLTARRLVEAGSKFVTVFWDAYGHFGNGWDTHVHHYPRLKQYLLPVFDQTYSALILDLESRGLLDDTLVLCLSEHGRTPEISNSNGGGRDHWSKAYSAIFAGGGMGAGNVVGQTDAIAGEVAETPVSPKDVLATAFYLMGIDPKTTIHDRLGRPHPIAGAGRVRTEFF